MPPAGNGVAEGVDAAARIERRPISRGKNDAGSADGGADRSGHDDAHAGGTGGLVACASNDGSAGTQTRFRGALAGNFAADIGRLVQGREQAFIDFGGLQHLLRPAAMGHIEKQRSRSVSHVSGTFAGETKTDVVLWEHYRQ